MDVGLAVRENEVGVEVDVRLVGEADVAHVAE